MQLGRVCMIRSDCKNGIGIVGKEGWRGGGDSCIAGECPCQSVIAMSSNLPASDIHIHTP